MDGWALQYTPCCYSVAGTVQYCSSECVATGGGEEDVGGSRRRGCVLADLGPVRFSRIRALEWFLAGLFL
jgi:hypothetical protein